MRTDTMPRTVVVDGRATDMKLATAIAVVLGLVAPAHAAANPVPVVTASTIDGSRTVTKLRENGDLVPAEIAPPRVKRVIRYANRINDKPYLWGGGHGRWNDRGYDCSGAVSYALHGGKFLDTPLDSTRLSSWGKAGKGKWITIYANSGHVFAEIAGFRWDTSGGPGPRWHRSPAPQSGFVARHPKGF